MSNKMLALKLGINHRFRKKSIQVFDINQPRTFLHITPNTIVHNDLKSVLAAKILNEKERVKKFRQEHGVKSVGEVFVDQIYNGMRGVKALVCETSVLDAENGIRFRGYSIPECREKLPKISEGLEPLPEGMFWLLLTGQIPTKQQVEYVSTEWANRAALPEYVYDVLSKIPYDVHPMSQFSATVTLLNNDSKFVKAYSERIKKPLYWEYFYEDAMNLIAKLPTIAAVIYQKCFKNNFRTLQVDKTKDWCTNFANMLGFDNPEFKELLRLYLTIHADHEGGNVSAHATHLVGSALSDTYLSFAAGLNGLAGPLHGLANQEVLIWLLKLQKVVGDNPTKEKLEEFIWLTLKSGNVVPGYGHAVLRKTDPRFTVQQEFGKKYLPNDPLVKLVSDLEKIVPEILIKLGKVKNPYPNVDAHSGVLLYHYGLKEMSFYTVLFGVSRSMGVLSSLIWDRAFGYPIERPKSISTADLIKMFNSKK